MAVTRCEEESRGTEMDQESKDNRRCRFEFAHIKTLKGRWDTA